MRKTMYKIIKRFQFLGRFTFIINPRFIIESCKHGVNP